MQRSNMKMKFKDAEGKSHSGLCVEYGQFGFRFREDGGEAITSFKLEEVTDVAFIQPGQAEEVQAPVVEEVKEVETDDDQEPVRKKGRSGKGS